jgi:hypothetical protein
MKAPAPETQHDWLQRLVGDWTYETVAQMAPDQPAQTFAGTETVRPVGKLWVVAEGRTEVPGGGETGLTMLTLGYDPRRKRFVGTWLGSMMAHLWVYDGGLDAAGDTLTLDTVGPDFGAADPAKTANYRETIVLAADGNGRTFASAMLGDDGKWVPLMTATYRRAKAG